MKTVRLTELEKIIKRTLTDFHAHVRDKKWYGKEREMVSFYAFGFLVPACRSGSVLHDPAQIGIEVRVPGVVGLNKKKQVCKDLLIWKDRGANCWNKAHESVNHPLMIMEWKDEGAGNSKYDLNWLKHFSRSRPDFVGLTVGMRIRKDAIQLQCAAVRKGIEVKDWLVLP